MKSATRNTTRGRPTSRVDGAPEAFDYVERYKQQQGIKNNELAIRFGMTPSTVNRALQSRETASWTPGFQKLYCNVKSAVQGKAAIQRLAEYAGPADSIVRRLIEDVDALVTTLSANK